MKPLLPLLLVFTLAGCAAEQRWVRTLETPETKQCFEIVRHKTCPQFVNGSVSVWLMGYEILTDESNPTNIRAMALQINRQIERHLWQLSELPECFDPQTGMAPYDWLVKLRVVEP